MSGRIVQTEAALVHACLQGYDLGDAPEDLSGYGDAIVAALKEQEQPGVITRGAAAVQRIAVATGARPTQPCSSVCSISCLVRAL
jgi:hypothetical protein